MLKAFAPDGLTMSIGDASIPMTMQAQVAHMSLDEAIASGLFDQPDEPGMERIPVTIHLALTPELRDAIARSNAAPDQGPPDRAIAPAAPHQRRRSGSHRSRGVPDLSGLAADHGFSRHAKPWHESEDWLDAPAHYATGAPGRQAAGAADVAPILRGMRHADHVAHSAGAIRIAGAPEEDERLDPEGRPLTFREGNNQQLYFDAYRELRKVDPGNPALDTLSSPGWIPDDAAVSRMQEAVRKAEAPNPDTRPRELLVPPAPEVVPSFKLGESDGGPGTWVRSPKYPAHRPDTAKYQQQATGALEGMEYRVQAILPGETKETTK